jgi:twitching motility two-component system response regulator PilH
VLLVEDNQVQRLANERILHKAGYEVLYAKDGEEALSVTREKVPDLVLLDMLLPKLGGREVILAMKKDPRTAQIPVLVYSGLPQTNEVKLTEEGAAGYFAKRRLVDEPGGERELLDLIESLLQESRTRRKVNNPKEARATG